MGGSTAVDIAVIVKLTRVAMLVPVAILIGLWFGKSEGSKEKDAWRDLPIPWFIFGFLAMSAVHSLGIIQKLLRDTLLSLLIC